MTKRILSMLLVLIVVSSLFAFVGCSNREETQQRISDLQQQMAELQSLLQQQTALLAELQNANSGITDQITELTNAQTATISQITELQEQLQSQAEKVTKIEDTINSNLIFDPAEAIQEVIKYAESKDKSSYYAGNWVFVENLIEMAETQIYKQRSKEDIYKLIQKIKASINRVPKEFGLGEIIPWDGKFSEEGEIIISLRGLFCGSRKLFTIDDFWMLDNIEMFELVKSDNSPEYTYNGQKYKYYDYLLIKLNPHNSETVAEAIEILEKLCYCKQVEVGVFTSVNN